MDIKNVIKESIKSYLFESLKTQKEKYGNELVDELKSLDPSTNYKYIDQICRFYNEGVNKEEIKKYIDLYNKYCNELDIKCNNLSDINTFNDLKEIIDFFEILNTNTTITNNDQFYKEIKTSIDIWDVYLPYTIQQQIELGKNTKWLISSKHDNWFNKYLLYHEVIFYIIIGKKTRTKYLISVYADGGIEISNSRDRTISNTDFYSKTGINLTEFKYIPFYDIHKGETNVYDETGKIIGKMISLGGGKGKYVEYYPNGNIESEIEYYNGKMDGKDIEYNKDGSIEEESVYKNGKRNGKFELFYDNGNLKSSVNLINNKREGKQVEYYPDGKIKKICNYINGNLEGEDIKYYENGNIAIKSNYKNDMLNGKYTEYYEDGKIKIEQNYKNGNLDGEYIEYDKNGNVIKKEYYKDGEVIKKET